MVSPPSPQASLRACAAYPAGSKTRPRASGSLFLRRRLLRGDILQRLSGADQAFPVLLDVVIRAAFIRHRLSDLRRWHHVDGVPGTPALAQLATDAPFQVDVHETLHGGL